MSEWLDPTGRSTYGIGLCDRCHEKFSIQDLFPDPNSPGLRVCKADLDQFDPYRLPARQTEDIHLEFTRPETPLDGHGNPVLSIWGDPVDPLMAWGTEDGDAILFQGDL
jgi:hypothetical protein